MHHHVATVAQSGQTVEIWPRPWKLPAVSWLIEKNHSPFCQFMKWTVRYTTEITPVKDKYPTIALRYSTSLGVLSYPTDCSMQWRRIININKQERNKPQPMSCPSDRLFHCPFSCQLRRTQNKWWDVCPNWRHILKFHSPLAWLWCKLPNVKKLNGKHASWFPQWGGLILCSSPDHTVASVLTDSMTSAPLMSWMERNPL